MKVKARHLEPINIEKDRYLELSTEIMRVLNEEVFNPLFDEFPNDFGVKVENSKKNDDLQSLIKKGKVSFYNGAFSGEFNAKASRQLRELGAVYDRSSKEYKVHLDTLPGELRVIIYSQRTLAQKLIDRIDKKLRSVRPKELAKKINYGNYLDKVFQRIESKVDESLNGIHVKTKYNKKQSAKIAEEYNKNMERYIVDFTEEEIEKLRDRLSASLLKGRRQKEFVAEIAHSYSISESRAKFIARQETSLFAAKLKETRYLAAGVKEYIWRTIRDGHKIREDHKLLDGTTQRFDKPPITNQKTKARNNPGEDYNCYCVAIPVVRF